MDKYYKYKHLFSGVYSKDDITFLCSKCPTEDKSLIECIINGMDLKDTIGITTMATLIDKANNKKHSVEIDEMIRELNVLYGFKLSDMQKTIFDKIKYSKTPIVDMPQIMLEKECPHCGLIKKSPVGTTYVICGVDSNGRAAIDFNHGCLNDWCFECGKKLCKNWCRDSLHNTVNRTHNGLCCQIHAADNKLKYVSNYCTCNEFANDDNDFINFIQSQL